MMINTSQITAFGVNLFRKKYNCGNNETRLIWYSFILWHWALGFSSFEERLNKISVTVIGNS